MYSTKHQCLKKKLFFFQESGHVCRGCYTELERQNVKRKRKMQSPTSVTPDQKKEKSEETPFQPLSTSTPATLGENKSKARQQLFSASKINSIWKDHKVLKIAQAIKNSKYQSAFRQILSRGESAQRQFNQVVQSQVQSQMRKYNKCNNFSAFDDMDSVTNFKLERTLEDMKTGLPTFNAAMTGAFTPRRFRKDKLEQLR